MDMSPYPHKSLSFTASFIGRLVSAAGMILVLSSVVLSQNSPRSLPALPQGIISTTEPFKPAVLIGVAVDPDEPFTLTFYLDPGDESFDPQSKDGVSEIERLIKYFLTSLTLPDDEQWVNLSPYERERIVPDALGLTLMGEDLLAADYTLLPLLIGMGVREFSVNPRLLPRVRRCIQQLNARDLEERLKQTLRVQ